MILARRKFMLVDGIEELKEANTLDEATQWILETAASTGTKTAIGAVLRLLSFHLCGYRLKMRKNASEKDASECILRKAKGYCLLQKRVSEIKVAKHSGWKRKN
jgi:hypothetical protein